MLSVNFYQNHLKRAVIPYFGISESEYIVYSIRKSYLGFNNLTVLENTKDIAFNVFFFLFTIQWQIPRKHLTAEIQLFCHSISH